MYLYFLNIIPLQPKFSLLNRKGPWGFCESLWCLEHSPVKGRRLTGGLKQGCWMYKPWLTLIINWLEKTPLQGGLPEPKSSYSKSFRHEIISSTDIF